MSEICPRRGKWFNGCKFEPRYDLGPVGEMDGFSYRGDNLVEALQAFRTMTYINDVCVSCGKAVRRLPEEKEQP